MSSETFTAAPTPTPIAGNVVVTPRNWEGPPLAVLWDLDGTLIDNESTSTAVINDILQPFNAFCNWELKKAITGKPAAAWTRMIIEDQKLEGQLLPEVLGSEWGRLMIERDAECAINPGVVELSSHLKALGIPQAVCTSSAKHVVEHKRSHRQSLFDRFDFVLTGDMPELQGRGKPNPDIYLMAAARLGVPPERCVVVEDAVSGCLAGKTAGMRVIGVPSDVRMMGDLEAARCADILLTSLAELDLGCLALPPYPN